MEATIVYWSLYYMCKNLCCMRCPPELFVVLIACSLACLLARWFACLLAGWLACLLACFLLLCVSFFLIRLEADCARRDQSV